MFLHRSLAISGCNKLMVTLALIFTALTTIEIGVCPVLVVAALLIIAAAALLFAKLVNRLTVVQSAATLRDEPRSATTPRRTRQPQRAPTATPFTDSSCGSHHSKSCWGTSPSSSSFSQLYSSRTQRGESSTRRSEITGAVGRTSSRWPPLQLGSLVWPLALALQPPSSLCINLS